VGFMRRALRSWYSSSMAESPPSAKALRVLLVEDNHDARTTLRLLLTLAYGHTVLEAADGPSAIDLALRNRPDVALVDVGLPGLSGYEVAQRIREALGSDGMYLVALTGYGTADDRKKASEAGFDLHLVKPVEASALERVFERVPARRAGGTSEA